MDHGHADAYSASRDDLGWFYAASGSALGLRGQSYGDVGSGVWDAAKSFRAHMALRTIGHRCDVERAERIAEHLVQIEPAKRHDLELVYTPFGAGRTTWQAYCVFTKGRCALLGLALHTPQLVQAYARRKGKSEGESVPTETLLRWVEHEVSRLDSKKIKPGHALPPGHVLLGALHAAARRELEGVAAYKALRDERYQRIQKANEKLLADETEKIRIRLWGAP